MAIHSVIARVSPRSPAGGGRVRTYSGSSPGPATGCATLLQVPAVQADSPQPRLKAYVPRGLHVRVAQPIADTRLGDHVLRPRRVGFELGADVGDVDAEVVRLGAVLGPPDLAQQLSVGH